MRWYKTKQPLVKKQRIMVYLNSFCVLQKPLLNYESLKSYDENHKVSLCSIKHPTL